MLRFQHGIPGRNTKAYIVTIGDLELFVSYETIIAARTLYERARLRNDWGPTTGRHINEMGLKDWPIVTEEELNRIATEAFICEAVRGAPLLSGKNDATSP